MRRLFQSRKFWIGSAFALLVAFYASPYLLARKYHTFHSPDGKYHLTTYRYQQFFAMPGGAGDASGYVVLTGPDGTELQRQSVLMVQQIYNPQWSKTNVSVKLQLDWKLP